MRHLAIEGLRNHCWHPQVKGCAALGGAGAAALYTQQDSQHVSDQMAGAKVFQDQAM